MSQRATKSAYLSRLKSSNNSLYYRVLCRLERTPTKRQRRVFSLYLKAVPQDQRQEVLEAWYGLYPKDDDE